MSQTLFYFDVVIACVAVLVMATSMVLTLNQLVLATLGKRRKILESSLANLFKDLGLETEQAAAVANGIVEDPRIEQQGGSVVTREQLVEMLLEHAAKSDQISTKLKDKLGVTDPGKTLVTLRNRVLQLEAASPELADHVRRTQAIVESAVNAAGTSVMEGIAKVMGDFDRVCDRMTHEMRAHARIWTIIFSAVATLVLPLDAIDIASRLANNPTEVRHLVDTARALKEAGAATNEVGADLEKLQLQLRAQTDRITSPALGIRPGAIIEGAYWQPTAPDRSTVAHVLQRVSGLLISIGLMSLGAPFWFDALKNLLALRPSLASKETADRTARAAAGSS